MPRPFPFENVNSSERFEHIPSQELERVNEAVAARDTKQEELIQLLAHPTQAPEARTKAWECWMALKMAQLDVDLLVKTQLDKYLSQ